MKFPYEKRFVEYLRQERFLEESTINDLMRDVTRLFEYLRNHNINYRNSLDLSTISNVDIKEYLNTLTSINNIKNTTYNKILTHINTYFKFLFTNDLSTSLPTLTLKGKKRHVSDFSSLYWADKLEEYLSNEELNYYTRMMLLLTKHFFTIKEMLQVNFYQELTHCNFTEFEQNFISNFYKAISDLQKRQHSSDIFLKKRLDIAAPQLTLPGLHKYLRKDQKKIDLKLSPRELYQNAICNYLLTHQDLTDVQLINDLRLTDVTSLNYYRQKAHEIEDTLIK